MLPTIFGVWAVVTVMLIVLSVQVCGEPRRVRRVARSAGVANNRDNSPRHHLSRCKRNNTGRKHRSSIKNECIGVEPNV